MFYAAKLKLFYKYTKKMLNYVSKCYTLCVEMLCITFESHSSSFVQRPACISVNMRVTSCKALEEEIKQLELFN